MLCGELNESRQGLVNLVRAACAEELRKLVHSSFEILSEEQEVHPETLLVETSEVFERAPKFTVVFCELIGI